MKTILTALCAIALLTSCGSLKKSVTATETYTKDTGSTSVAEVVTVKEKVDTVVTVVADSSDASVAIEQATDTAITVIDTPTQRVDVLYDPISKRIRTKAVVKERAVPVQIERETVVNRTQESDYKSVTSEETSSKDIKKTNPLIPWWVWLILVMAGLYYLYRCLKKVVY